MPNTGISSFHLCQAPCETCNHVQVQTLGDLVEAKMFPMTPDEQKCTSFVDMAVLEEYQAFTSSCPTLSMTSLLPILASRGPFASDQV